MNKKGLLVLFLIFFFMLILNMMTPLLSDDFFIAFVWPEGVRINENLPIDARKVSSFSDVFDSLKAYYSIWGGRLPGQGFMTIFSWWGKESFNFVNSFMAVLLIVLIYWISDEGKISFDFKPSYIFWIFFALWSFNIVFVDTFLWLSGSCEYLWMLVLLLLFLLPFVQNYCNPERLKNDTIILSLSMFVLGLLVGCSRETMICWIIVILTYWIYLCRKSNSLQFWKVSGYTGLCIGYVILIIAPGNIGRLGLLDRMTFNAGISFLLDFKLRENVKILFFHLFLWHFLIRCFLKFRNSFFENNTKIRNILVIAKVCILLAFCSGLLMSFVPTSGFRTSFVNLCFLIIAAASLFKIQDEIGFSLVDVKVLKIMKLAGYSYFIMTVVVSLWGNYINWIEWNDIIHLVEKEQQSKTNHVLEISPYSTNTNINLWVLGSGNHIVWNSLADNENDGINKSFSKYYNIRGIRIKE